MGQLMPAPLNGEAADRVRQAAGVDLPDELRMTTDHLAVVRHLVTQPAALIRARAEATAVEVKCGRTCRPAPWLDGLLVDITTRGIPWAVFTNDSADAVRAYLGRRGYPPPAAIEGRTADAVDRLKPDPYLVYRAVSAASLPGDAALFVGDSVSDVTAGRAAGVPVLGYAKNAERAEELQRAGAVVIHEA